MQTTAIDGQEYAAEFRFIRPHPVGGPSSYVETAAGPLWVNDKFLTYDPPRDLTPEAAAVIEREIL